MNPRERFVVPRTRYVEKPPELDYSPTDTVLARFLKERATASAWVSGTAPGEICVDIDGDRVLSDLSADEIRIAKALGSPAPFGRGENTLHDPTVRRSTQIEGERLTVDGDGWKYALRAIRSALTDRMGLTGCDIEMDIHKLLIYDKGDHFSIHADTEKAQCMVASAAVILSTRHDGGAIVTHHNGTDARLLDKPIAEGSVQWAVWYADVQHEIERVRLGQRLAITLNVRLGKDRPLTTNVLQSRDGWRFHGRSFSDWHTKWADRAGLQGTGSEQYKRKTIRLLDHRYTDPGLRGDLLKGKDRQVAAILSGMGERVLLGRIEIRTVGNVDDERGFAYTAGAYTTGESRDMEVWHDEESDRAGLDLAHVHEDEYYEPEYLNCVMTPESLPLLTQTQVRRRDIWIEDIRTLDGQPTDYGRIAAEPCELSPAKMIDALETSGARIYEATGNEGASMELQYRHAVLVSWPKSKSTLVMLAECGGRNAITAELRSSWEGNLPYRGRASGIEPRKVVELWKRAMQTDGGAPAPEAHRTIIKFLDDDIEYTKCIAVIDLDEAGAETVATALHMHPELAPRLKHHFGFSATSGSDHGAVALLQRLIKDDDGQRIARVLCGAEEEETMDAAFIRVRRDAHERIYQRRLLSRFTMDYPGDGKPTAPA